MDKKTAPSGTERIIDIPDSVGRYEAMDLCDALYRAGHTAKSEGSDSCSDARSKPEWLECHAAFNRQGRALLRATTALAEAEAKIAELLAREQREAERSKKQGIILDHAMRGQRHSAEQPHDGRMDAVRTMAARIAELKKALVPFAEEARKGLNFGSTCPVDLAQVFSITVGDLRRAAALLKEAQ